ncbi:MAG TPA: SRPBCC domain-containing protein [Myxococcaceae bacterium]
MSDADKKTFTIERMLKASTEKVWMMCTTREGLERWWGPEGFTVQVLHIDVRVGGHFELIMKTEVPEIVAMLKQGGMDASSRLRGDYTVVEPNRRLAYTNAVDFVPGVAPYKATTRIELTAVSGGTRLAVTNDVMHDAMWTERARMGWEQELGKLERALG